MSSQQIYRIMIITRSDLSQKTRSGHIIKTKILEEIGSTQGVEEGSCRFYTASVI